MFDTSNSKLKLMSNIELDFFRSQEGFLFRCLPLPHVSNLVELTGIEPVASWLQTRRSPS
jgi:hypothetical protein